jgi:hypothetical protein
MLHIVPLLFQKKNPYEISSNEYNRFNLAEVHGISKNIIVSVDEISMKKRIGMVE